MMVMVVMVLPMVDRISSVVGDWFRASDLSATDILGQIILGCEGLSCALRGFEQNPSPLPTRCQ